MSPRMRDQLHVSAHNHHGYIINIPHLGFPPRRPGGRHPAGGSYLQQFVLKPGEQSGSVTSSDPDPRPDCIVIGSGAAGLSCASLLTRAGKRVLVLEQHDIAGGCLHTYAADGFEWDVGIHYCGEVGGRGIHRLILDQLTCGRLKWNALTKVYDFCCVSGGRGDKAVSHPIVEESEKKLHSVVSDSYRVFPFGPDFATSEGRLKSSFPEHAGPIGKFFTDIRKMQTSGLFWLFPKILPRFLCRLLLPLVDRLPSFLPGGNFYTQLSTPTRTMLEERCGITDPLLQTVLTYSWGDLGNTPATLPYAIMLGLHSHFMTAGAFFPVGGAGMIAWSLVQTIRDQGGEVLVKCPVQEVLVENSQTVGVQLDNGKKIFLRPGGTIISSVSFAALHTRLLSGYFYRKAEELPKKLPPTLGTGEPGVRGMILTIRDRVVG